MKLGDAITWVYYISWWGREPHRVLRRSWIVDLPAGLIYVRGHDALDTIVGLLPEGEGTTWHFGHDDPVADTALLAAHALANTMSHV